MEPDSAERPLKPAASTGPEPQWFKHHAVGLLTLLIGVVGFIVVATQQDQFWDQPDWRLAVPFFVAAVAGGAVSLARREGAIALPLLGIGLAGAALVLGWFLVFGIVVGITAVAILILSHVM
ncbi:MAG: hypothetical protein KC464_01850 [Myxococcales bacterium]|nr:hypothetical protein [Myxococcales bacterium]